MGSRFIWGLSPKVPFLIHMSRYGADAGRNAGRQVCRPIAGVCQTHIQCSPSRLPIGLLELTSRRPTWVPGYRWRRRTLCGSGIDTARFVVEHADMALIVGNLFCILVKATSRSVPHVAWENKHAHLWKCRCSRVRSSAKKPIPVSSSVKLGFCDKQNCVDNKTCRYMVAPSYR
jgi:hypothetical protein